MSNDFFARSSFSNVVFKNVNLANTSFIHSRFKNVKFVECILYNTIFDNVCGMEYVKFIDNER